jgi:hypothetical protein
MYLGKAYKAELTCVQTIYLKRWYHVTVVRNGTMLYLYIDGILENSMKISGDPIVYED